MQLTYVAGELDRIVHNSTPPEVMHLLKTARVIGVAGSRAPSAATLALYTWLFPYIAEHLSAEINTGDASGVDASIRLAMIGHEDRLHRFNAEFSATVHPAVPLINRTIDCVEATATADAPVWLAFPDKPCKNNKQPLITLRPSRSPKYCFRGFGGSWAGLALAAGLGMPCIIGLPHDTPLPENEGWHWRRLDSNWAIRTP